MLAVLFQLLAGSAFVLLGRWIYKNPKKVYPNWLYSNPDSLFLTGFARVFATMVIFVGSCAVIIALVSHLLPGYMLVIVALAGAIASAWLLRPPVQAAEAPTVGGSGTTQVPTRQGFLSKKGKWIVGISVGVAVLLIFGVFAIIGNSEVCQLALQRAQSSPVVIERLGQPIERGLIVSGSIETSGPSGHADVAIPVSGSKAKGTLYAVGVKSAGIWKFETLQVEVEGDSNRVDLLDNSPHPKPAQP
jgi:hypothetical protein